VEQLSEQARSPLRTASNQIKSIKAVKRDEWRKKEEIW
jgi:hypothetical protein